MRNLVSTLLLTEQKQQHPGVLCKRAIQRAETKSKTHGRLTASRKQHVSNTHVLPGEQHSLCEAPTKHGLPHGKVPETVPWKSKDPPTSPYTSGPRFKQLFSLNLLALLPIRPGQAHCKMRTGAPCSKIMKMTKATAEHGARCRVLPQAAVRGAPTPRGQPGAPRAIVSLGGGGWGVEVGREEGCRESFQPASFSVQAAGHRGRNSCLPPSTLGKQCLSNLTILCLGTGGRLLVSLFGWSALSNNTCRCHSLPKITPKDTYRNGAFRYSTHCSTLHPRAWLDAK